MADPKIGPALTAEEWARVREIGDEAEFAITGPGDAKSWGESILKRSGPGALHAAAALCLHGQPFGPTWGMVKFLRGEGVMLEADGRSERAAEVVRIASFIEALLPPEGA